MRAVLIFLICSFFNILLLAGLVLRSNSTDNPRNPAHSSRAAPKLGELVTLEGSNKILTAKLDKLKSKLEFRTNSRLPRKGWVRVPRDVVSKIRVTESDGSISDELIAGLELTENDVEILETEIRSRYDQAISAQQQALTKNSTDSGDVYLIDALPNEFEACAEALRQGFGEVVDPEIAAILAEGVMSGQPLLSNLGKKKKVSVETRGLRKTMKVELPRGAGYTIPVGGSIDDHGNVKFLSYLYQVISGRRGNPNE